MAIVCHSLFPSPTLPNKANLKGDLIKVSLHDYLIDWTSSYILFSRYNPIRYYDKHTVQIPHIPCIIDASTLKLQVPTIKTTKP